MREICTFMHHAAQHRMRPRTDVDYYTLEIANVLPETVKQLRFHG
jgi:hypothetical protein